MMHFGQILYPLGFTEEPAADDGEFAFSYDTRRHHHFEFVIEAGSDEKFVEEFENLYNNFSAAELAGYLGETESIAVISSAEEIKSAMKEALDALRVFV